MSLHEVENFKFQRSFPLTFQKNHITNVYCKTIFQFCQILHSHLKAHKPGNDTNEEKVEYLNVPDNIPVFPDIKTHLASPFEGLDDEIA